MNIAKVVGGFFMSVALPFGLAIAEPVRDLAAAPASALIEGLAGAVGPEAAVSKVMVMGQGVLIQGSARDPAAVLESLSASPLIDSPRLLPMTHDANLDRQLFTVTATISAQGKVRPGGGLRMDNPEKELVGHARHVLDSHMAATCELISEQRVSEDAADAAILGMAMRWRCPGTLPQLIAALRDLELGAPALTLSDYLVYVTTPGKLASDAETHVEVRFTATASTLAAR